MKKLLHFYLPSFLSVCLLLAAGFFWLNVKEATASCGSGYSFCRTVTVDATKAGASDSASFTVLASTTLASLKTVGNSGAIQHTVAFNSQTVPADLVFSTTADCSTLMKWDFEGYVATTGEMEAWVLLTTLSHTVNTTFTMCYGNSSISTYQGGTVGAAWDTNYKSVWHMPNGTSLSGADATSNNNTGTISGATANAGNIDGGTSDDGAATKYILGANTVNAALATISAWVKVTALPASGSAEVAGFIQGNLGGTNDKQLKIDSLSNAYFYVYDGSGKTTPGTGISTGTWIYLTGVANGTNAILYLNGAVGNSIAAGNSYAAYTGPNILALGHDGSGNTTNYLNGSIDELEVSSSVRSADWILSEYNNQKPGSTMVTFGAEQSASTATPCSGAAKGGLTVCGATLTVKEVALKFRSN